MIYAALGAIVAVVVVAGIAWVIVQDAKATGDVSERWRDDHWRGRNDG